MPKQSGKPPPKPLLAKYGKLDSCRAVMRAYELYRYDLYKEKYENNGRTERQLGREK